jgi:hypothetical protein
MSWSVLMTFVVLAFGAVIALAWFKAMSLNQAAGADDFSAGLHYQRGKPLCSAAERAFLEVLDQAVAVDAGIAASAPGHGGGYRVFGKVRVADVVALKPGLNPWARQGALNRIAAKHFDFVLCRSSDLAVVCAVELAGRS